jgi:hypothetical protein
MAKMDGAGVDRGTLEVSPGFVRVRPFRRRRWYELPIDVVAAVVVQRVLMAEVAERRKAKLEARKARRRTG